MALSREAYQALEDIVGPENISEEPVTLDSYAWIANVDLVRPDGRAGFWIRQPEAAVLPGSAEEVQAVVKACNRYHIKCKPFSTGWTPHALPLSEGVINLDLRRMNRLLELDEKNMFAVVEPYVITAQLQAEAMKVGLNISISGAGSSCSALAGATAGGGGPSNLFMGSLSENQLGLEWVMPNGDMLRTGSSGAGLSWFCGEGPGPSLKGIVKGTGGALGVFTKCAIKLTPWPGPAVLPVEGTIPAYNSPLPKNIRAYTLVTPSWQAYAELHYKIYDSEIGYLAEREFNKWGEDLWIPYYVMYNDPTKSIDDLDEVAQRPEVKKLTDEVRHYNIQFVLAGMTPRDIEYQEKVLDQILADTGGHRVAALAEPTMQAFTALYLIRLPIKNDNYVLGGGGRRSGGGTGGIPDLVVAHLPAVIQLMKKHQEKGLLVKMGGDALKGRVGGMGGGGVFGYEERANWDPSDIESIKGTREYYEDSMKLAREVGLPTAQSILGIEVIDRTSEEQQAALARSPQPARFHWQWKIKKVLDPNDAGDSKSYTALEKPPKE